MLCACWCVVRMIDDTASLSWRVRTMHLIGWQNTWEQAPGVPATLSPRQRRTLRHRGLAPHDAVAPLRPGLQREARPLPRGVLCARRLECVACSTSFLALALVWPLEAWCVYSARAIATLCRSCFSHERRRRSLRRRAAPSPSSPPAIIMTSR